MPSVSKSGYVKMYFEGKMRYEHRVVWYMHHGAWPQGQIDHINGNRGDNRIENLRVVDNTDNHRNMKRFKTNTSGVPGVVWHKQAGKWAANIRVCYQRISLGLYHNWFDAVCARKAAEAEYGFHANHGRA